jgi:hypothetical protein
MSLQLTKQTINRYWVTESVLLILQCVPQSCRKGKITISLNHTAKISISYTTSFLLPVTSRRRTSNPKCYTLTHNGHWTPIHLYKRYMCFIVCSPNESNCNNIIIFHSHKTVLLYSYNWQICQSHPQHCWHKLLKFSKMPRTEFVCDNRFK